MLFIPQVSDNSLGHIACKATWRVNQAGNPLHELFVVSLEQVQMPPCLQSQLLVPRLV